MFSTSSYLAPNDHDPLTQLRADAEKCLRASVEEFVYPSALKGRGANHKLWEIQCSEIDLLNQKTLKSVDGRAGVYAIFTAERQQGWDLQYLGQVKSAGARARIRSHLVWRNKKTKSGRYTGSKFDEVQAALRQGKDIGFAFVQIEPAALRHYVEEVLIHSLQPGWNFHGTTLLGQRSNFRCRGW
jgi:hypothetical protein